MRLLFLGRIAQVSVSTLLVNELSKDHRTISVFPALSADAVSRSEKSRARFFWRGFTLGSAGERAKYEADGKIACVRVRRVSFRPKIYFFRRWLGFWGLPTVILQSLERSAGIVNVASDAVGVTRFCDVALFVWLTHFRDFFQINWIV